MSTSRKSVKNTNKPNPWQLEIGKSMVAPDSACVGVGQTMDPEKVLDLAVENSLQHICQRDGHFFDAELASSYAMIESPESYLQFPVATIFAPHKLNLASERSLLALDAPFNSSKQKQEVLDTISKTLESKGISQTIADNVHLVADEYFTNAIYNAPFVDLDTHKNPGISRQSLEVKLDGSKTARMFMAMDEERLLIGCQDPFGSLDLGRFLNRVRSSYKRGPGAMINFGAGGAGIGSYMIFDAGSSLYFGVWPNRATILCCLIPLGMSNRKRMQLAKHLHWIQQR